MWRYKQYASLRKTCFGGHTALLILTPYVVPNLYDCYVELKRGYFGEKKKFVWTLLTFTVWVTSLETLFKISFVFCRIFCRKCWGE